MMRRFFPLLFVPLLAGCDARNSPLLRDTARAVLTAKAFDKTTLALKRGDDVAMRESVDELARLDGDRKGSGATLRLATAESLVIAAIRGEIESAKSSPKEKRDAARVASENYRRALAFAPDFPSKSPDLLNALGYFLADRGSTREDFTQAETLTRRALALYPDAKPNVYRANTRDSLAWALYKLGRFTEAESEQGKAIEEARKSKGLSAELLLHLGEIHIETGKKEEARAALEGALKQKNTDAQTTKRARELLETVT